MRNLDKKQRLLESVRGLHKDTMAILQMDVTDQQSILDAKRNVAEGRIDILGKRTSDLMPFQREKVCIKIKVKSPHELHCAYMVYTI